VENDLLSDVTVSANVADGTVLVRGGSSAAIYLLDQNLKRLIPSKSIKSKYQLNGNVGVFPRAPWLALPRGRHLFEYASDDVQITPCHEGGRGRITLPLQQMTLGAGREALIMLFHGQSRVAGRIIQKKVGQIAPGMNGTENTLPSWWFSSRYGFGRVFSRVRLEGDIASDALFTREPGYRLTIASCG
jgi:hypothetical protein